MNTSIYTSYYYVVQYLIMRGSVTLILYVDNVNIKTIVINEILDGDTALYSN